MKVIHINAVRSGSTGRTAVDLKDYITRNNGQYKIAFSECDSYPLNGDIIIGNKFDHKLHALLSRIFGLQGYFSYFSTKSFLKKVEEFSPDFIVLANLHANYLNLPLLFKYLANHSIPVVMILDDCWFFTAKCTHFTTKKCDKWQSLCVNCSKTNSANKSWLFDRSEKVFKDRKKWYNSIKSLSVVAVSDWELKLAYKSPLFVSANLSRIYNWVDTDIFSATNKHVINERYNIAPNTKYVISVGADWEPSSTKTRDALLFAQLLPDNYKLIIVGRGCHNLKSNNIVSIPYVQNQSELAALYSASNAYIHFSVEDTFGKVIAEAMACETIPFVFNSTACGEIAGPYGVVVEPHDVKAMVNSLNIADDNERRRLAREYALQHYSKLYNLQLYYKLFRDIIKHEED